jgi:hypothetical protein
MPLIFKATFAILTTLTLWAFAGPRAESEDRPVAQLACAAKHQSAVAMDAWNAKRSPC